MFTKIIDIYKKTSFLTKIHIWIRYSTCPFLEIEQFVPKEGLIIDYGCGLGIFSHILSILSGKRKIYGFDISKTKIEEAKNTVNTDRRINFSSDKNQIEEIIKISDCVALLDVICYFSNQEREDVLKSFYKNLKKGSILIIKDIRKSFSLKYAWLYLQELIAVRLLKITKANNLNFFNTSYLSKFLDDVGFKVQVIDISKDYFYPHILFVCKKGR